MSEVKIIKVQGGQKLVCVWMHNGQECPYLGLAGPGIRKFSSYLMIDRDLNLAKICFKQIIDLKDSEEEFLTSIFSNATISYGRPFTRGEGRTAMLDGRATYKGNNSYLIGHNQLMNLRHKFVAHSGGTEFESTLVFLALNPDALNPGVVEVYRGLVRAASLDKSFCALAVACIDHALDHVKKKIDLLYLKILSECKKQDLEKLYKEATFPSDLPENFVKIPVSERFDPKV